LPASNLPELRARLDHYARTRLTLADFEPTLHLDAELSLHQVTPDLFQALESLQPFGVGNPQPVFAARAVRLMAPPRVLKEKHVKLKLAPAVAAFSLDSGADISILATPHRDPDSSAQRGRDAKQETTNNLQRTTANWRNAVAYEALGWHMAERCQQAALLPGDNLEIAFTIDNNDHPEYGGLELSLRDFRSQTKAAEATKDDTAVRSDYRKSASATSP